MYQEEKENKMIFSQRCEVKKKIPFRIKNTSNSNAICLNVDVMKKSCKGSKNKQ